MAAATVTAGQLNGLPSLDQALPPPPQVVTDNVHANRAWTIVSKLYAELAAAKVERLSMTNKVRRAFAPTLILGLKVLARIARAEIAKLQPGIWKSKQKSGDPMIMSWLHVMEHSLSRVRRWTADTSSIQMTANDENNNHSILDLIRNHQRRGNHWCLTLAQENVEAVQGVLARQSSRPSLRRWFSFAPRLHDSDTMIGYLYLADLLFLMERYMELVPESRPAIKMNVSTAIRHNVKAMDVYERTVISGVVAAQADAQ